LLNLTIPAFHPQQMTMQPKQVKQPETKKITSQSVMRSMKVSQPLMRFRMVGHQMRSMRVQHGAMVLLTRFQTLVCRMYSVRQIFLM